MTNLELAKQFIAEMHYGPYETAAGIESFAEWLDKRAAEPREIIHTVGIGYCDNCDCEHCSEIRNPART